MPGGVVAGISPAPARPVEPGSSPAKGARPALETVARLAALPGVDTASGVAATAEQAQVTGQVLPVAPALVELLPWGGLRRGSTVAVTGSTSLLLALLAEATAQGSWAAAVGLPRLGLVAARELGVEVNRLALIPRPGADFASVTAALLDGVDLVATAAPKRFGGTQTARRLSARARHRGAVLLSLGPWPGAEVQLHCTTVSWAGAEEGHGYLRERSIVVDVTGRRGASRGFRTSLLLPGPGRAHPVTGPGVEPSGQEVKAG